MDHINRLPTEKRDEYLEAAEKDGFTERQLDLLKVILALAGEEDGSVNRDRWEDCFGLERGTLPRP